MDSVSGLLLLLEEEALQKDALEGLNKVVDTNWSEIIICLDSITNISDENPHSPLGELASAIASKCSYHIQLYDQALLFALKAGEFLDLSQDDEYCLTITSRAIESYIKQCNEPEAVDEEEDPVVSELRAEAIKKRLDKLVSMLFTKCIEHGNLKEALGIALESKNVDKIMEVLEKSGSQKKESISYCIENVLTTTKDLGFRDEVLEALVAFFDSNIAKENYIQLLICLLTLGKSKAFSDLMTSLVKGGDHEQQLIAVQAAFLLVELNDATFIRSVKETFPEEETSNIWKLLNEILDGKLDKKLQIEFLNRKCKSDFSVFKKIKGVVTQKFAPSFLRNASLVSYAYMQAGTGSNSFLKRAEGLDFMKPSANWARFSCVANYGVIHKHNYEKEAETLRDFLPKEDLAASKGGFFSDGGSLYAKGLLNSGSGNVEDVNYITSFIQLAKNKKTENAKKEDWEPVSAGACYALGLVGVGAGADLDSQILWTILKDDDAIASESAAIGLGLLYLGKGNQDMITKMVDAMKNTDHEKIIRASSMAIALSLSKMRNKLASSTIELLVSDPDAIIRYSGMFAIGLSAIGTSAPEEIGRLLKVAVSDVNDDVRRAAVISLGLVCLNQPERVPELINLLAESFNPHVRYGAAIALGIASTNITPKANAEGIRILKLLADDKVDYVRQGALIAMSMGMSGYNWEVEGEPKSCFDKLCETLENNKVSPVVKMGAILGLGILEQGGRNSGIELIKNVSTRVNIVKTPAVAGMVLFLQYWYWYPFLHMLSLSFAPKSLVGVSFDKEFKNLYVPKDFEVECDISNDDLKAYSYPEPIKAKKIEHKVMIQTAVLSMTNKAKQNEKTKESDKMEVAEETKEEEKVAELTEEKRKELLMNPLRVLSQEKPFITFPDGRFTPVLGSQTRKQGVVVLSDGKKEELAAEECFTTIPIFTQVRAEPAEEVGEVGAVETISEGEGVIN